MSGLGIVLEEAESPQPLLSTPQQTHTLESDSESLLPPLPDGEPGDLLRMTTTSPVHESPKSHGRTTSAPASEDEPKQLSDLFSDHLFTLYELDLPALNIDALPLAFPPVESQGSSVLLHPASATAASSASSTSPLKRLKSLKNGIRKLSLSKMTNSAVTDLPPPPRPVLAPLQTESHDASSVSSATDSLRSSTFSNLLLPAAGINHSPTCEACVGTLHTHGSSQSLVPKSRRRTLSSSHCNSAATTPSGPSPIITLSENLSSSRKNLCDIEQSFLQSVTGEPASTSELHKTGGIGQLSSSHELIEYLVYLNEHKKSVLDAYDVTTERLSSSGWCSSHDLENLSLQKDSLLSQIDTKLLQIEEKLNADFNLSMLNNPCVHHPAKGMLSQVMQNEPRDVSLSPSLKVLESRCMAFTTES